MSGVFGIWESEGERESSGDDGGVWLRSGGVLGDEEDEWIVAFLAKPFVLAILIRLVSFFF